MSKQTYDNEIKLRGIALKVSVMIEAFLMTTVFFSNADHFGGNKEAATLKMNRVTFGQKIKRTKELLLIYHPDLLVTYEELFQIVDEFLVLRNRLCHCPLTWENQQIENFIIWEVQEDENKYEHMLPIVYNLSDTYNHLNLVLNSVLLPLKSLSSEVQARLKASHPQVFDLIMSAYNAPETS